MTPVNLAGQFGDTTYTKVFVGGLAWETQKETMKKYFKQFGEILEAAVITDKATGRSKGYGFVTFREPEAAMRACVDPAPVIDGRKANYNLASLGVQRSKPSTPKHVPCVMFSPDHITRKVCDYVAPYGLWNFHILYPIINSQVRDRSRAIPPSNALKGANFVSWLGSLDGGFKVSKAYLGLFDFNALNIDPLLDNIWKLKVPKRFQILSWKFRVNSLLTNEDRCSRNISFDASC
ncbi:hypothetical protein JHK84_043546 [Glycine max]|nr:hypothetical protein JHK84_043546 [Glycine max]